MTVSCEDGRREGSKAGVSGRDSFELKVLWLIIVAGVVAALRIGSEDVEAIALAFLASYRAFA